MTKKTWLSLLPFLCLIWAGAARGQEISYKGELTGLFSKLEEQTGNDWLFRYLPEIRLDGEEGEIWTWDASLAAYLYAFDSPTLGEDQNAEIFRAWFRVFDETTEFRIGLQELSFGPAQLLRSLQWFDTKSPLDPTSFTKGVRGALIRISTEDDSSYWIWALYGNEDQYASTLYASDTEQPEFGGRAQFSSETFEHALSFHQRQVVLAGQESVTERRIGLDFKLDLEYNALWLESMAIDRSANLAYSNQERYITIGIDYSIEIFKETLILIAERNWGEAKTAATDFAASTDNTALTASIGVGLLDSCSIAIMNTEIPKSRLIRFDWKRTYDDYLWDFSLFQYKQGTTPAQFGLGLIFQYNH